MLVLRAIFNLVNGSNGRVRQDMNAEQFYRILLVVVYMIKLSICDRTTTDLNPRYLLRKAEIELPKGKSFVII